MSKFELSNKPKKPESNDVFFLVVSENSILYEESKKNFLFSSDKILVDYKALKDQVIYIGKIDNKEIYAIEFPDFSVESLKFIHLYMLLDKMETDEKNIIYRARQLLHWDKTSQYCGSCGSKTYTAENEFVKICVSCSQKFFPQYSPAIIVCVTRGNEVLLGRSYSFRKGMYSTLAGFVEPGELCEDAVSREVREEVGIEIQNIKYHSMQLWPFPNSLMIGYMAEYKSGSLKVDKKELEDAQWFHFEKLPILPIKSSIAYQLINEFLKNNQRKTYFLNQNVTSDTNEKSHNEALSWMKKRIGKAQSEKWKNKCNQEKPNATDSVVLRSNL